MSILVSSFLHRDDVSTVINVKSEEIRKKGQTYWRRALTTQWPIFIKKSFCQKIPPKWVPQSVPLTKKYKNGSTEVKDIRNVLEKRLTSTEKLVELTQDHLPNFSRHIYNVRHQFETLRSLRETLTQNDVVVHIDYSENYACKNTREIKETHFGGGHQQATPHTGVLYLCRGKVKSFASFSGCLQHTTTVTWAHLDP